MTDRWLCSICGYTHKGDSPPVSCPSCGAPFTSFQRKGRGAKQRLRSVEIARQRPAGYRYVIVGNSAAGRSAARAISILDPDGHLTVISEEAVDIYGRPLLPDLIGGMDRDEFFASGGQYQTKGLDLVLEDGCERLDPGAKTVTCASGRELPFDALLLATGSEPIRIPWPGAEAEGVAYFRTFADAERIAGLASSAGQAVVVGGGLLGLEFVRAFLAAGLQVTQLIREARVGAPALDEDAGLVIQAALEDTGVTLAFEEEVDSFEADATGRVCAVKTSAGRSLECSLVGVAVGARPRVQLAQEAGIDIDRAVLVDTQFRTSAPDVYAAGDAAQAMDILWHERRVITSWRTADEQGEYAGIAMAGGDREYPGGIAANYQLAAGLPFCSLGISNPADDQGFTVEVVADTDARTFRRLIKRDDVLVGAVLIGDLSQAAEIEQQLRPSGPDDSVSAPETTETDAEPEPKRRSSMHKMTRENVKDAFAGESQAHIKYANFAEKAEEEGKPNVARLFQAASFSEQMHATRHLDVLAGVGTTSENLAEAIDGESFEVEEMYPAYMVVAEEQGEEDASTSLHRAREAEKVHLGAYERAKDAVDAGQDADAGAIHVCSWCGFTMEGEPPAKCPMCKAPRKLFKEF